MACEPIIRQIRRENPSAFIVFVVQRAYRELLESHPDVNHTLAVLCISEWARLARGSFFDEIVDLNIAGRFCGFCREPWYRREGNHGVTCENYYLVGNLLEAYCKSAGRPIPISGPKVYPRSSDVIAVDRIRLPQRFVVLHAGSNEEGRRIPVSTWRAAVHHINKKWNLPVVEVGLTRLALDEKDSFNFSLCGVLPILQTAEVISRSLLYLGSDSGPGHLANAMGAYGVIALGHYRHFYQYLPYSGDYANQVRCELLYHDGPVGEIPLIRIVAAVDRRLSSMS